MKPDNLVLRIDARLIASIFADVAVVEAAERVRQSLAELKNFEALREKLAAGILDAVTAESAVLLMAPLNSSRELAARAMRENSAIMAGSMAFIPMQHGVIQVEAKATKPFTLPDVHRLIAIAREAGPALHFMRHIEGLVGAKSDLEEFNFGKEGIIGQSAPMREVFDLIYKVAPLDSTIMVLGESGTGKDLVARAIHANGPRRDKPFISVNCAALNENLIESELFGHVRGAFTGAHATKKGKFEVADGGTIFLDEIGDLPLHVQVKLFRVLQNREFEPVGGTETLQVDVRVIVATNQDLKKMVQQKRFREELYYRLNVIQFTTPALRDRREDIPLLAGHFRTRCRTRQRPVDRFAPDAMEILCSYDWPGNVRELQNIIERAVGLSDGDTVHVENLPADIREAAGADLPRLGLDAAVLEFKKSFIERVLIEVDWDVALAAERLGIIRQSLYRLAKRLGIDLAASD